MLTFPPHPRSDQRPEQGSDGRRHGGVTYQTNLRVDHRDLGIASGSTRLVSGGPVRDCRIAGQPQKSSIIAEIPLSASDGSQEKARNPTVGCWFMPSKKDEKPGVWIVSVQVLPLDSGSAGLDAMPGYQHPVSGVNFNVAVVSRGECVMPSSDWPPVSLPEAVHRGSWWSVRPCIFAASEVTVGRQSTDLRSMYLCNTRLSITNHPPSPDRQRVSQPTPTSRGCRCAEAAAVDPISAPHLILDFQLQPSAPPILTH